MLKYLTKALPAYRAPNHDDYKSESEISERWGILLPCDEGLLLVGGPVGERSNGYLADAGRRGQI